jgi:hypothetical protein
VAGADILKAPDNGSKTACGYWMPPGHFHPGFQGSLHSKGIAFKHEIVRTISHTYYRCCQRPVLFAAPVSLLHLLHQHCVDDEALQLLTAVRQVALTHTVVGQSDRPEGWDRLYHAAEGVAARGRSGSLSCSMLACQTWGHGNRQCAADSLQENHGTAAPSSLPTTRPHHDRNTK